MPYKNSFVRFLRPISIFGLLDTDHFEHYVTRVMKAGSIVLRTKLYE